MADETSENAPFDLDRLRELIEMMEKHGLTEVSLRRGDEKWKLRRGPQETALPAIAVAPAGVGQSVPEVPERAGQTSASVNDDSIEIKSPTVGTFYAAPSPDDPPFVQVGARVDADTIVCIIEAMKVFNQIPAELSGTIIEILVNNGDPVEFGQALFRARPG